MDKLREFGRKAMFYARVLSGYEERRIRNYRLQLEKRLQQAQEKKAALRKIPEQVILSEVRKMVEDMQALNKQLEETEAAIEEYFGPIDKQAEIIMKMQLDREGETMKDMLKTMEAQAQEKAEEELKAIEMMKNVQKQILRERAEAEKSASQSSQKTEPETKKPAQMS